MKSQRSISDSSSILVGLPESGIWVSSKAPYIAPQTGYYQDIVEMAAALFESLLMNHPFVDGNKRVAFFAVDVFLRLNGWKLEVEPGPAHDFLIGLLARGECDFDHLLPWLQSSMTKL